MINKPLKNSIKYANIKQVKKVAPIEIQKPIVNTENQKTEDILKQMNDYLDKTKRRKDK